MIDDNFKLWLIEANTNPCLELSCPLLSRIIPTMVENLFRYRINNIKELLLILYFHHLSLKNGLKIKNYLFQIMY